MNRQTGHDLSDTPHNKVIDGISTGFSAKRTILVVDDEELVRNFSAAVLRDFGYSVLTGSNGREAIAVFTGGPRPVEMLFTDISMPEMGGLELARCLRSIQPKLPVLFTSGDVGVHPIAEALGDGQSDFLKKPFGVDALALKVQKLFDYVN